MADEKKLTPIKAIRAYCIKCKGLQKSLKCEETECPLHPYRSGKGGGTGRTLTDEQKAKARERLNAARAARKNG